MARNTRDCDGCSGRNSPETSSVINGAIRSLLPVEFGKKHWHSKGKGPAMQLDENKKNFELREICAHGERGVRRPFMAGLLAQGTIPLASGDTRGRAVRQRGWRLFGAARRTGGLVAGRG